MNPCSIDLDRIDAFARHLRHSNEAVAFDFCSRSEGVIYPERGHPATLDYLFFTCAHQFGFWTLDGNRWAAPMIARIDGIDRKGSDFLFRAATRAIHRHPRALSPQNLSSMSDAALDALFHDDQSTNPLPLWPEHLALIRAYADWFARHPSSPADLLRAANASPKPLRALLDTLSRLPGYAEDPLAKKAMLLAITLENRPERFLRVTDPESARPIIDYHLQRSALRTGLVRVESPSLLARLEARTLLSADDEHAVRSATCLAIQHLMDRSGLSAAAVDFFFFQNRTRCPETTPPDCPDCPVHPICARQTRLFQPVFRTTAY